MSAWGCETCGAIDSIESDGINLRCDECGATPQDEPDRDRQVEIASGKLFELIVRTRFRNPGTSADPYTDALVLWVSVVNEVRKAVEPLEVRPSIVRDIEYVYRESVEAWLRGDEPKYAYADDPVTARVMDDEDLEHRLREAIDPPTAWIA